MTTFLFIEDLWNNVENAYNAIKNVVYTFIDIVSAIFGFLPSPFDDILSVVLIIIVALVVVKIVGKLT